MQAAKFRKAVAASVIILLAVMIVAAADVAPALSLSLPLETPTVPVKTPPVTVKTPTVTLSTPTVPTVPVKVPTVPVQTPTVKAPTVPVKTPTVPVKTPAVPVKTTVTKTPIVPVKTPTVPATAPTVTAKTPPVAVHAAPGGGGPTVSVKTPTGGPVGAGGSGTSPTAARGGSSGSAAAGSASGSAPSPYGGSGGGSATASAPLVSHASPGVTYGELPSIEGSPSRHARARIARRERRLKATVARFRGCLSAIAATERTVLELRTGYGAGHPLGPRATAARLHIANARIAGVEAQALRELGHAAGTHSCGETSRFVAGAISLIGATLGGGGPAASGGVEAVRYSASPTSRAAKSSGDKGILGVGISPAASDALLVLGLLFGVGLVVLAVVADAAGQGPRHARWRQRMINRMRPL